MKEPGSNITLSWFQALKLELTNVEKIRYIFDIYGVDIDSLIVLVLVLAFNVWLVVFPHLKVHSVPQWLCCKRDTCHLIVKSLLMWLTCYSPNFHLIYFWIQSLHFSLKPDLIYSFNIFTDEEKGLTTPLQFKVIFAL